MLGTNKVFFLRAGRVLQKIIWNDSRQPQQPVVVKVSQGKFLEFRDLLLLERECKRGGTQEAQYTGIEDDDTEESMAVSPLMKKRKQRLVK